MNWRIITDVYPIEDVNQLFDKGGWDTNLLGSLFFKEVCEHITDKMVVDDDLEEWDMPW